MDRPTPLLQQLHCFHQSVVEDFSPVTTPLAAMPGGAFLVDLSGRPTEDLRLGPLLRGERRATA
ncbi:MAG: hypothetical protein JF886_09395 [Candidatus Dormibacteraeota bacterium]|uniref:Uncharacterized protein n=1 Tax=Candidatus Aeolococcus gillhamiae TaxID=3127015 RepID=A0A934NA96_9BACT|nr:hypothetical protein [Candidatus Dormibacteraeota bacterium]